MLRRSMVVLAVPFLGGCATSKLVPDDYGGPVAELADSSDNFVKAGFMKPAKVDFFYASKIDGKNVDNALSRTASRYAGQGFGFEPLSYRRRIPAKTLTVEIAGQTYHGAEIGGLLGKSYHVSGTVTFAATPDQTYVVKGQLGPDYSAVWIETSAGEIVGTKIEKRG